MANTIKLKQGSGSDPSASDLVLGEPAIRTDTGEIFLKKDDGSIAKVAGGIDDGDKGDITVSNDGGTFTIDNDAVTYAKIQNVSATNRILGRDSSGAGVIEEITPANLRTMLNVADGATNVTNTNQLTNGAGFLTSVGTSNISNDAVTFDKIENIATGGIMGRNNSGTGSMERLTASEVRTLINVENGATADQTASEILTLIKTVDGSGSGLDADTLDGVSSGSFLRSDAADTASENITINGLKVGELSGSAAYKGIFHSSQSSSEYMIISNDGHTLISATGGSNVYIRNGANDSTNQLIIASGNDALTWRGNKVFHAGNDGAGSGLDADSVDGIAGSSLLRSDAADTASGDITFSGGAGAVTIAANSDISLTNGSWTGNHTKIQHNSNRLYIVGGSDGIRFRESGTDRWLIDGDGHFNPAADSTYDIGETSSRVRVGYFDELDSAEVRVNNGILETKATIATSHSLTSGFNAMAVSPTINSGVTVTVPSGAVWAIV